MESLIIHLAVIIFIGSGFLFIIYGAIFQQEFSKNIFASEGEWSFLGFSVKGVVFVVILLGLASLLTYLASNVQDRELGDLNSQVQNLQDKNRAIKTQLQNTINSANIIKDKQEEQSKQLISAQTRLSNLSNAKQAKNEVDKRVSELNITIETLRNKISELNSEIFKLAVRKDYVYLDVLSKGKDDPIPGTEFSLRLKGVSSFAQKAKLIFKSESKEAASENPILEMTQGESRNIELSGKNYRIYLLGADNYPERAGIVIEKL